MLHVTLLTVRGVQATCYEISTFLVFCGELHNVVGETDRNFYVVIVGDLVLVILQSEDSLQKCAKNKISGNETMLREFLKLLLLLLDALSTHYTTRCKIS